MRDKNLDRRRRKARARGARHMVSQGLTLYYQSLVHRVIEDTPSYFEHVVQQAQSKSAGVRSECSARR
jgi:hypothetical protein